MPPKTFYRINPEAFIFRAKLKESENDKEWVALPEEKVRQWILYELIRTYGYLINDIKIEQPVTVGTRKHFADIVIFKDDTPFIVIECKRRKFNKIDQGVDQAISYAASKQMMAEYAVFSNGRQWIVKRLMNNEWVTIPDIPKLLNNEYQNKLEPFIIELQDILPSLYWIDKPVPTNEAKDFFSCLDEVFYGHSLFNSGLNKNLKFTTDLVLRILSDFDAHEGYVHGKISGALSQINQFRESIGEKNVFIFDESKSTIRELVLDCISHLRNMANASKGIGNADIKLIRFNLALFEYYLNHFHQKKYVDLLPDLLAEFGTLFKYLINKNLGFGLQDPLLAENNSELHSIYVQAWEKFKKESV